MRAFKNIKIAPYHEDILNIISKDILRRYSHSLPDLHDITVFLPGGLAFKPLREKLIKGAAELGHSALILPACTTLRHWVLTNYPPDKPLLSQYARELILVDAIKQQELGLFAHANPWAVADELLSLFDAMQLNNVPCKNFQNHFTEHKLDTHISDALSQEADWVTTLWSAWQQQLSHENLLDPQAAYVQAIQKVVLPEHKVYYVAGLDRLSECELALFEKTEDQSQLQVFVHGSNPELSCKPDSAVKGFVSSHTNVDSCSAEEIPPYSRFLDEVFINNSTGIKQRAVNFSEIHPTSPVTPHLKIYKSSSFEHHVKAIDIKIRSYIRENKENIGVVTADRKLARRLRAVLEHANVQVNDLGGWALATTSAAVIIKSWLQLIEENYAATQLLALLKSPFYPVSIEQSVHDDAVNFFEKDIILHSNLDSGLKRYRNAIERFQARQDAESTHPFDYLYELLDHLETATRGLAKLSRAKSIPLHRLFEELINGLKISGIYTTLKKDDAGEQIIDLFESQIVQVQKIENSMNWLEWRRFLARTLDQQNYKPPSVTSSVTFCNLRQSRLLNFDALIIASVDKNHFPGNSGNYIFFNERIRSELNIPTWLDEHAVHFHLFRRLLDAAPDILITVQSEQNNEKTTPSPWVEAIETFHSMAYESDLLDTELHSLVTQADTDIVCAQHIPMPSLSSQPSPVLTAELKPESISISQYQTLMDCPYQFFVHACLGLAKTDELKDKLDKGDFGSLVHECIHAFFVDKPSMPGPFKGKVTADTREAAEKMLVSISEHVFNQDAEHGFSGQLWLRRWRTLIPAFINWEIQQQEYYMPHEHEISLRADISPAKSIHGRVDRIDRMQVTKSTEEPKERYTIIDYKTGYTPSKKAVIAGEQVQLPTYALLYSLLHKKCISVKYLNIGKDDTVTTKVKLYAGQLKDADQFEDLVDKHHLRLVKFFNALEKGAHFTALADDSVCDRCEARGLCRKDYWRS